MRQCRYGLAAWEVRVGDMAGCMVKLQVGDMACGNADMSWRHVGAPAVSVVRAQVGDMVKVPTVSVIQTIGTLIAGNIVENTVVRRQRSSQQTDFPFKYRPTKITERSIE